MEKSFRAETEATPAELLTVVGDLGTYPEWLDVVTGAEPVAAGPDEVGPVWMVTLRARIGPLSRSKRLRMCRTELVEHDGGGTVRFDRCETDGRDHAAWVMTAEVGVPHRPEGAADGDSPAVSEVELALRYDGGMWTGVLDGLLDSAADEATAKLRRRVTAQRH